MLNHELEKKLDEYRSLRSFNEKQWLEQKVNKFINFLKEEGITKIVLPVSGGVDSALSAAILKYTHNKYPEVLEEFCLVSIPIYSSNWAIKRASELAKSLEKKLHIIDLTEIFDFIIKIIENCLKTKANTFIRGQAKSYMRPMVVYTMAQLLSKDGNLAVVMGTGNMDEDGYLGYFCKAGDGVCDFQLIWDLHKSEVFRMAKFLGVPESIVNAKPSADLWEGQYDETELGISYDFIELYTGHYLKLDEQGKNLFLLGLTNDARAQFLDFGGKAEIVHKKNKHKLEGVKNI